MIIAQHLLDRANGALAIEPEVAHPTYSMFNSGGVEVEVGEFLHSMVRVTKPMHILETGTHLGVSAAFMALALYGLSCFSKNFFLDNPLLIQYFIYLS